jgi:hypothetical protein
MMTDLSPEAKHLMRQARTAFSPPEGRLEAVRAALRVQIAAAHGAAISTSPTTGPVSSVATRAIGAAGWGTGHAIGAAVLIGALGAGGVVGWLTTDRPTPASRAPVEAPAQVEPTSEEITLPLEEDETFPDGPPPAVTAMPISPPLPPEISPSSKSSTAPRDHTRLAARPRSKAETTREAPEAPIAPATDSLAEEVSMLRSARAALDRGDATQALRLLGTHETRFQRAILYEERLATRVLALCALGRIDAARSTAKELERAAPRSPHLTRVRASCIGQPSGK